MRQLASCGVANMLKVLATLRRNKHAQEINACVGRPFAQRASTLLVILQLVGVAWAIRTRSEKRRAARYTITRCRTEAKEYGECARWAMYDVFRRLNMERFG